MQPKVHVHYSPAKSGFVSAMFYIESETDVYGWHAEARGHHFSAAFFMIENFYTKRGTVLYRSVDDDVYGPWTIDMPAIGNEARCPLPEPVLHELERIQSQFVEEWLFFENDPDIEAELSAYRQRQLPVLALNVKSKKLKRLETKGHAFEHSTPGSNPSVLDYVQKYLRHNEKTPAR